MSLHGPALKRSRCHAYWPQLLVCRLGKEGGRCADSAAPARTGVRWGTLEKKAKKTFSSHQPTGEEKAALASFPSKPASRASPPSMHRRPSITSSLPALHTLAHNSQSFRPSNQRPTRRARGGQTAERHRALVLTKYLAAPRMALDGICSCRASIAPSLPLQHMQRPNAFRWHKPVCVATPLQ
ncbi:hypothetical protein M3J09_006886 [Ascochyta lentis]